MVIDKLVIGYYLEIVIWSLGFNTLYRRGGGTRKTRRLQVPVRTTLLWVRFPPAAQKYKTQKSKLKSKSYNLKLRTNLMNLESGIWNCKDLYSCLLVRQGKILDSK